MRLSELIREIEDDEEIMEVAKEVENFVVSECKERMHRGETEGVLVFNKDELRAKYGDEKTEMGVQFFKIKSLILSSDFVDDGIEGLIGNDVPVGESIH